MRNCFMHRSSCCHAKRLDSSLATFHWQSLKRESKGSLVTYFLASGTIRPRISKRTGQTLQRNRRADKWTHHNNTWSKLASTYLIFFSRSKPWFASAFFLLSIFFITRSPQYHNTIILVKEEFWLWWTSLKCCSEHCTAASCLSDALETKQKLCFWAHQNLHVRVQFNRQAGKCQHTVRGQNSQTANHAENNIPVCLISNKCTERNQSTLIWGFSTGDTNSGHCQQSSYCFQNPGRCGRLWITLY